MSRFLAVGVGGFLGAVTRYAVSLAVARVWSHEFPLATLLINVSGSFLLGLFLAGVDPLPLDPRWRLMVATGFMGAYTTFSTFEYETHRLAQSGALAWAALNVVVSVAVGFAAVRLGAGLVR